MAMCTGRMGTIIDSPVGRPAGGTCRFVQAHGPPGRCQMPLITASIAAMIS